MLKKTFKIILTLVVTFLVSTFFIGNTLNFIKTKYKFQILINPIKLFEVIKTNPTNIYGIFLLFLLICLFVLNYYINLNYKIKEKDDIPDKSGSNEYGSARWASDKDLKRFKIWDISKPIKSGGIVVTCNKDKFYYDDSTNHTLVIGTTGSGKTVSTIMPLIINLADASESMIINDSKGELLRKTNDYLINKGYKIKIINLREPTNSNFWNPLYLPYKYYKEKRLFI